MAKQKRIQVGTMRLQVRFLALLHELRSSIAVSCAVSHRHRLDPVLLWLWHRLAAVTPVGPLAWVPPCATGVALKIKKRKTQDLSLVA